MSFQLQVSRCCLGLPLSSQWLALKWAAQGLMVIFSFLIRTLKFCLYSPNILISLKISFPTKQKKNVACSDRLHPLRCTPQQKLMAVPFCFYQWFIGDAGWGPTDHVTKPAPKRWFLFLLLLLSHDLISIRFDLFSLSPFASGVTA